MFIDVQKLSPWGKKVYQLFLDGKIKQWHWDSICAREIAHHDAMQALNPNDEKTVRRAQKTFIGKSCARELFRENYGDLIA